MVRCPGLGPLESHLPRQSGCGGPKRLGHARRLRRHPMPQSQRLTRAPSHGGHRQAQALSPRLGDWHTRPQSQMRTYLASLLRSSATNGAGRKGRLATASRNWGDH